jgi:glycerophosphoryl diester phosphodiesterase
MLESLPRPVVFAHRGASSYAPENTLAAFRLAVELGADAIELDAKLSADGQVMVIHDQSVDRTTNGSGNVNQLRGEYLGQLDAGSTFDHKYTGEPVPTLDQVFSEVGGKIFINVELTNYASGRDNLVPQVAELVEKHRLQDSVMFSSFNPVNLRKIHRLLPDCPVAILALAGNAGFLSRSIIGRWFSPQIVHPYLDDTTADFVRRQHRLGRRVHVWTVNMAEDMRRLFKMGVDGIFTDDPVLAMRIREEA